jgi:hypothetical protein
MSRLAAFRLAFAGLGVLSVGAAVSWPNESFEAGKDGTAGKALLAPDDFTFVGSYAFSAENQATFGMGLTCRRVDDQLRFLTISYDGPVKARLIEFALPDQVGQPITKLTASWNDIWSPGPVPNCGGGDPYGVWWDERAEGRGRLWTTHATDYPADPMPAGSPTGINSPFAVAVRTLSPDGTVGDFRGEYGFTKIGQRAIYGGVQAIPQWFRDKYGINQPYAIGWGGTAARMAQGLGPSLGLMALAIPDVAAYKAGAIIPAADFRILADHRSGTGGKDWYGSGKPTKFDRGWRNPDVLNYFDSGDNRPNPRTPPTSKPAAGAQWQSPAPDKRGRFVWSDSYYNTGCWIDGANKGGFIVIGSFAKGKAFYMNSTLHNEGRHAELQIFDPHDFGKVLKCKLAPWNVQPAASKLLTADLTPLGLLYPNSGNNPGGAVAGATFDAKTGMLYLWCTCVNGKYGCCLAAYKVRC